MMAFIDAFIDGARRLLGFFSDPIVRDAVGGLGVYLVTPSAALWYGKRIKRTRRKAGDPLSDWDFIGMCAALSFLAALFFANRLAGWPLDRAINHALFVAFVLPWGLPKVVALLERVAPDIADEFDVPTEYSGEDTTEIAPMASRECSDSARK